MKSGDGRGLRGVGPLVIAALLGSAPLGGQEAEPPTFASGTEAVLLDMVVRDEDGKLVHDLRADEVQVFEDGQLCEITSFRLVQAGDARPSGADLAGPSAGPPGPFDVSPGGPGGGRQGLQPPAEGARSASVEDESLGREGRGGERLGNVVLLVFDHLGRDAASRARAAALDMIARPFPQETWFAVLGIGQSITVYRTFTRDRSSLARPIQQATPGTDRAGTEALSPGYASAAEEALALAFGVDAMEAGGASSGALALEQATAALAAFNARNEGIRRGQESLYPLVALTRALQNVTARKTMLYFSEGLPVPEDLQEVFWSSISEANRSNLTVYGFDARGLATEGPGADAGSVSTEAGAAAASPWTEARSILNRLALRPAGSPGDDRAMMRTLTSNPQQNLQNLSEGTGGVFVANTNDLRPGLERVAADLRTYYEIAYTTPNTSADGGWRSLEVKVSRPGARVRARKGYFALPPGAPVVRPSELPLTVALDGDALPREVPLRAAAVHLAGAGEERDVLVALKVPLRAATFEPVSDAPGGGERSAELALLARVRDQDGHLVARLSHDTALEGAGSEVEAIQAQSLVVKRALRLAPGRYTLEAAVLDRGSNRVGASRVAFEVPAQAGLSLGSLTVVRPEPLPEGSTDLLRAGDVRGTPRLGEPFVATGGEVVGVFVSLHPGGSPEPPELTLEVSRNGQVVSRSEAELPPADARGRVSYLGQLPAPAFEPGRYVLHARARQGTEAATAATSFRVVAPETPSPPAPGRAASAPAARDQEPVTPPGVPGDVAPILQAAARYLVAFQERFRDLVAEESYRQWGGPEVMTLRSDVVFVRVPGDVPWVTFRDVFEVNGQAVRDREARLEKLFSNPDASTLERANAILKESARYNVGRVYRTINTPTLALVMLLPRNQGRFRWERTGTRDFHGHTGVELQAEEVASPSLVRDRAGEDVKARARFWIEAGTGRVLRTDVRYRFPLGSTAIARGKTPSAWVDTRFRPEPSLALWVPDTMYERYEELGASRYSGNLLGYVEGRARYDSYRRFKVETSEGGARVSEEQTPPPEVESPSGVPVAVAPLLGAAGRYVVDFQGRFRDIVAEETYFQWRGSETRKLRSDIVFVTLPGDVPWVTFRDVFEVSGKMVRDRDARLEALFRNPDASAWERAEAIRQESARYNLGGFYRTINVPTLALVALHPRFQDHFEWKRKGSRKIHGRAGVELRGVEVTRPTLVRDVDGSDVVSDVRAWIEPDTGRVLRTEVHYRLFGHDVDADAWIETQYRPEPSLATWVPEVMEERYDRRFGMTVSGRAEYTNHRRFQVETAEEGARLTEEDSP